MPQKKTLTSMDFSSNAAMYRQSAVVQQAAADRLFQLLMLKPGERVLDLGCGSGALTQRIHHITGGPTLGIDAAPGMVSLAREDHREPGLEFRELRAQQVASLGTACYDAVFCNSTLHWLQPVGPVIKGLHQVLVPGGRVGVQAAAMSEYCPNFIRAIDRVRNDPRTSAWFKHFVAPWTFLESEEAYAQLFSSHGFRVPYVAFDTVRTLHPVEEAFGVFSAGAAAGYLDTHNYRQDFPPDYLDDFLAVIRDSLETQADKQGMVELVFNRVYLMAFRDR